MASALILIPFVKQACLGGYYAHCGYFAYFKISQKERLTPALYVRVIGQDQFIRKIPALSLDYWTKDSPRNNVVLSFWKKV